MKLRFYTDLWPGSLRPEKTLTATTFPVDKPAGCRRVAFDVVIPDDVANGVDHYCEPAELVKE